MKPVLCGAFLVVSLLRANAASAQTDVQGAAGAYTRGVAALHADRYGDAVIEFEASYRLNPIPRVLYNLALAYRGTGRYVRALDAFDRYLREQAAVPSDRREAIVSEMQALRSRVGIVACHVRPANARFHVDGEVRACTSSVFVDPGERLFEVEAEGYRATSHRVRIAPGSEVDFRVDLVPSDDSVTSGASTVHPARAITADPQTFRRQPVYARWWFWTAVGVLVAGGVAAGVVLANQTPSTPDVHQDVTVEAVTFR